MAAKRWIFGLLLFVGSVSLLAWGIHTALQGNPLGADFYTAWKAARAELIEHRSPYDPEVAREIQIDIQGHLSQPGEDQFAFSYPLFGLYLIAPLAFLSFDWAQAVWMGFNFLLALAAGLSVSPRSRRWLGATFWLFYPVSFALILGNFDLLISILWLFFLAQTIAQEQNGPKDAIGLGLLLSITTLKPQFSWLFLIYTLLWVLSRRAWKFGGGFLAGCLLLWLAPLLWHPNWIAEWSNQILIYLGTNAGHSSPVNFWLGLLPASLSQPLKWLALALLGGFTFFIFLQTWRRQISSIQLLAGCGIVVYLVHPTGLSYEQMTFLIPLFLWAVNERRKILAGLVWFGAILLSWLSLAATLTKLDPLADSSWLLIAACVGFIWLFVRRKPDERPGV